MHKSDTRPGTGYSPLTKEQCEEQKGDLGIAACNYNNDYWAGAVKACGGISNMPSQDQLTQLAKYVYNTDSINSSGYTYDLALDTEKASQFLSASPYSTYFYVWSGQEYSQNDAYTRSFNSTHTGWYDNYARNSGKLAVCVDN